MSSRSGLPLLLAVLFGAVPAASQAHHSFAMFDMAKQVTVSGVVEDFQWTNPHSWLDLRVVDKQNRQEKVSLEAYSPSMLGRRGWTKASVKPGDKVTATFYPMRNGTKGGALRELTLADGSVLSSYAFGDTPGGKN